MKDKVLIFGGTTEGRMLSEELTRAKIAHKVSVATEYGKEVLEDTGEKELFVGRKTSEEIRRIITEEGFLHVVDATHPFAREASEQIRKACDAAGVEYIRLVRNTGNDTPGNDRVFYADTWEEIIAELNSTKGRLLALTGSKELERIIEAVEDIIPRLFVRVLPDEESIRKCRALGLKGKQIIAMQGPFSKQMNIALIKETGAGCIISKESGRNGGFFEKLEAARECNIKAIVLRNSDSKEEGLSYGEVLSLLGVEKPSCKKITLAGMGPGDERYYTGEFTEALEKADIIFGAQSVINRIKRGNIPLIPKFRGEEIYTYLQKHPGYQNPLALFSGDISLCSGAKTVSVFFKEKGFEVKKISGISSAVVFAERLGISLESAKLISAHGRYANALGYALRTPELIILPSNTKDAFDICTKLSDISSKLMVGYELGTKEELLIDFKAEGDRLAVLTGRCIIYSYNPKALKYTIYSGISDDDFIRGKTPMTKEEIRTLSIRKLALTGEAVLYDIGAGTGSISVEAALLHPDIKVYSIEQDQEAASLLRQNKVKHNADNMEITEGTAPEILYKLPAPTHAFVGGSGGRLKEIIRLILEKNNNTRIVVNCVTAETFSELIDLVDESGEMECDIIQVWVSRYKKTGKYHMPKTLSPVYIVSLERVEDYGK